MTNRIPKDAFTYYFSLGANRSFQALATEYGVSKQAVSKLATSENWKERLEAIAQRAREKTDQQIVETIEEMNSRHLRLVKMVQARGAEALKDMPLSNAMEAVRAIDIALKQERLIRGEPTDRNEVSVAEVVKRESERWLVHKKDVDTDDEDVVDRD